MLLQHSLAEAGMARQTGRAALVLRGEHRSLLSNLAGSRTAAQREVQRAKVLLAYAQGKSPTQIQRALGVSPRECPADQRGGQGVGGRSGLPQAQGPWACG